MLCSSSARSPAAETVLTRGTRGLEAAPRDRGAHRLRRGRRPGLESRVDVDRVIGPFALREGAAHRQERSQRRAVPRPEPAARAVAGRPAPAQRQRRAAEPQRDRRQLRAQADGALHADRSAPRAGGGSRRRVGGGLRRRRHRREPQRAHLRQARGPGVRAVQQDDSQLRRTPGALDLHQRARGAERCRRAASWSSRPTRTWR